MWQNKECAFFEIRFGDNKINLLAFFEKNKDMKDRKRQDMQDKDQPLYQELTETILGCFLMLGLLINFRKRKLYTNEFIILIIMPLAILLILFLYFRNSDKQNSRKRMAIVNRSFWLRICNIIKYLPFNWTDTVRESASCPTAHKLLVWGQPRRLKRLVVSLRIAFYPRTYLPSCLNFRCKGR